MEPLPGPAPAGALDGAGETPHLTDRRVVRSRRAIRDALVALVLETGYGGITVEAIIQRADVSRATFYAHFHDIDDVLTTLVGELAADLVERAERSAGLGPVLTGEAIADLCRHADEHRELYRVILSGAADGQARATFAAVATAAVARAFGRMVEANGAVPLLDVAVVSRMWMGSYLGLLEWWLHDAPDRGAEEVAAECTRLTFFGFVWALGLGGKVHLDEARPPGAGRS